MAHKLQLDDLLICLKSYDETNRKQAKLDCIIAIMEGETSNFSAGVYISVLAGFAIAVGNLGMSPLSVLTQVLDHAKRETQRLLKDQGITLKKSVD